MNHDQRRDKGRSEPKRRERVPSGRSPGAPRGGGRGRAGPRDAKPQAEEAPAPIPKVRTAQGTRVARSIICSECKATDTLAFIPRRMERVLCRACAAQLLGVVDPEAGIYAEQVLECTECHRTEQTRYSGEAPFVCKDCRRGIVSQQQDRTRSAERLAEGKVLRVRKRPPED